MITKEEQRTQTIRIESEKSFAERNAYLEKQIDLEKLVKENSELKDNEELLLDMLRTQLLTTGDSLEPEQLSICVYRELDRYSRSVSRVNEGKTRWLNGWTHGIPVTLTDLKRRLRYWVKIAQQEYPDIPSGHKAYRKFHEDYLFYLYQFEIENEINENIER